MKWKGLAVLAGLCCSAMAYDKEDHEIFNLVDALETAEGKGVSFYDFLNVSSSATTPEISRMYRKRSLELHPDKNKGVPNAEERFARLGVIANILRDESMRKRYHFFYKNGVPKWKGTGWYYERYRPGLGSVVVLLLLLSCLVQYVAQYVTYLSERKRVQRFRAAAKELAYGSRPDTTKKRVRVPIAVGSGAPISDRTLFQGGAPMLDLQVQGEQVSIVTKEGNFVLDDTTASKPTVSGTWLPSFFLNLLPRQSRQVPAVTSEPDKAATPSEGPTKHKKGKAKRA